ncbi:MAG: hypothetical protein SFY69_07225 [Planctomycetota bacterium]|nr:hypothetical protein [Planctomycetota bacterium]
MSDAMRGYVFVARWPPGAGPEFVADLLERAFGFAPQDAALTARRTTPAMVYRGDLGECGVGLRRLLEEGVVGLGVSNEHLRRMTEPPCLRVLRAALGAPEPLYMAEFARARGGPAESMPLRASDIRLIVRGRSRTVQEQVRDRGVGDYLRTRVEPTSGLPIPEDRTVRDRQASYVELVDLHLRDGTHLRCDGSTFSFRETLGDERGLTDIDNADRLALRLAGQAPRAVVDTQFDGATWTASLLGDLMSVRASRGGMDRRGLLAFSVYSAVLGLVRLVERGARAPWPYGGAG